MRSLLAVPNEIQINLEHGRDNLGKIGNGLVLTIQWDHAKFSTRCKWHLL